MMEHVDPDNLPEGTVVDGWRVVRQLGGGAYGTVYLVEKGGDFYAMKVARFREQSHDARHTDARAQRELACLLSLRHPHIVRVWACGRWPHAREGFFYVVMDYVEGFSLAEWMERTRATAHEVVVLFDKVLAAVADMHGKGIFHRDLKPNNILVCAKDGEPVVVDYGAAHFPVPAVPQLTDTRLPPGTPRYTSPEAIRFEAEHRHDKAARYEFKATDELYALGVTLYDLLTDPQPHSDPQPHPLAPWGVALAVELNERVPGPLSKFVARLLEREPAKRPVSAEAARRDIAEMLPLQAEQWTKWPLHALPQQAPAEAEPVAPREKAREEPMPGPVAPVVVPVAPEPSEAPLADTLPREATRELPAHRWRWMGSVAVGALAVGILLAWGAYLSHPGAAQEPPAHPVTAAEEAAPRSGSPPTGAEPLAPPPVFSSPASQPLPQPPPPQPVSNPEKGPPVSIRPPSEGAVPPPCSQKQPPPRGTSRWRAWCKCAGIVGTLAASQAGCPAAQVRQSPTAECTAESVAAMQLLDVEFTYRALNVEYDVKQPCPEGTKRCCDIDVCIHDGPVTSRVVEGSGKLVPGTLLSGQAWTNGVEGLTMRWTEATLPDGSKHPVCIEAGSVKERCPDGVGRQDCSVGFADIVKRWDRELTR